MNDFTPCMLPPKPSTWSSIRTMRGETTITALFPAPSPLTMFGSTNSCHSQSNENVLPIVKLNVAPPSRKHEVSPAYSREQRKTYLRSRLHLQSPLQSWRMTHHTPDSVYGWKYWSVTVSRNSMKIWRMRRQCFPVPLFPFVEREKRGPGYEARDGVYHPQHSAVHPVPLYNTCDRMGYFLS